MDVGVGIATCNRPQHLAEALGGVFEQRRLPDEVIVVDDSTGGFSENRDVVERYRRRSDGDPAIRYEARREPPCLSSSWNLLVEKTDGDVICFLDDDAVPSEQWIAELLAEYERTDPMAVGGPAISTDDRLEPIVDVVTADRDWNEMNRFGETSMEAGRWVPPEPKSRTNLIGANMSFRTDVFEEYGYFDPGFEGPGLLAETEFLARLREEETRYVPGALVYHKQAPSGGVRMSAADLRSRFYWLARNSVRLRWKQFGDVFVRSFLRSMLLGRGRNPSIFEQLRDCARNRTTVPLWWTAGYLDGLRKETDLLAVLDEGTESGTEGEER